MAATVAGIGSTPYCKRGTSPHSELRLILEAILTADAGLDAHDVDGFGTSASQVPGAAVSLLLGGPVAPLRLD